jgi:hypothetical protein
MVEPESELLNESSDPPQADRKHASVNLVADEDGIADEQFLNDLSASRRFMSFLLGHGRQVPDEITEKMGRLMSAFLKDIKKYEENPGPKTVGHS